ncbi:MAG: GNAT family N-acetyltransferase [Bacteroides sp.]|nr:GNAT family N-acetyltransferase [Bacteroides sp.]
MNFRFHPDKYDENKESNKNPENIRIEPTTKADFEAMKGTVIPSSFWNNANDFINNGKGFSLYVGDKLACIAFSAFLNKNQLELGIETCEEYRGKHFAYITCSALIDYCLNNNLEPLWAC